MSATRVKNMDSLILVNKRIPVGKKIVFCHVRVLDLAHLKFAIGFQLLIEQFRTDRVIQYK
jgi:hypothetical protein